MLLFALPPVLLLHLREKLSKKHSSTLLVKKNTLHLLPVTGPDGGIGRRAGLKHQWPKGCAGSIPAPGTNTNSKSPDS